MLVQTVQTLIGAVLSGPSMFAIPFALYRGITTQLEVLHLLLTRCLKIGTLRYTTAGVTFIETLDASIVQSLIFSIDTMLYSNSDFSFRQRYIINASKISFFQALVILQIFILQFNSQNGVSLDTGRRILGEGMHKEGEKDNRYWKSAYPFDCQSKGIMNA